MDEHASINTPEASSGTAPVDTILHTGDSVKQEKQTSLREDMPTEKDVPFLLFFSRYLA